MNIFNTLKNTNAQTMIEYMMLLAVVASIVLVAFKTDILPGIQESSNIYFNRTAWGIYGNANRCGDGVLGPFENSDNCCVDAGNC